MDTSTLEKHQEYTRKEFTDNLYYKTVLEILKKAKIKSSLDIGGCTGEVTKILQEEIPTLKRCVIVEPLSDNVAFIRNNIDAEIVHGAMYYGEKEVTVAILSNVGGGTICASGYPFGSETVKAYRLEDLGKFDFIKMDIEGAERNVIENSPTLKDIPFIEIEFHHYDEELQHAEKRPDFLKKWLPNHKIICGGKDSDKESSLFLSL